MDINEIAERIVGKEIVNVDVTFGEDASHTRKGSAPQNLALLKRLALNMVKKDQERYLEGRL